MKFLAYISLTILTFSSCAPKPGSTELKNNFTGAEIQDLLSLTQFFQQEMCADEMDFETCMDSLNPFLLENGWQPVLNNVNFREQIQLYDQLESDIFSEIWNFCKSRNLKVNKEYKSVCVNQDGKYMRFLEELSSRNRSLKHYYIRLRESGGFDPMGTLERMIYNRPQDFDMGEPKIQVLIAIHYLSLNDEQKRKDLWTENGSSKSRPDTLLNTTDYLVLGRKAAEVKVVNDEDLDAYPSFEIIAEYRKDIIIGENIEEDSGEVYKKYRPKSNFDDYETGIYNGKLADPDFGTHPDAKRFITRIKNECAKGINFAGYFTLVTWGCGTSCQSGVVVDRKTGRIFDGFGTTSLGSKFRKDSRLLIRNVGAIDTTTNLIRVCAYCDVSHEVWTGTEFKQVK